MKKITQSFGADLKWINSMAENFEGEVEGNFINVAPHIHTGSRYFLDCGNDITALYIDVMYHSDLQLIQKNVSNDFVALYFNFSQTETRFTLKNGSNMLGSWTYNLALLDSSLEFQIDFKKGDKISMMCIFIKRETFTEYAKENTQFIKKINKIINPEINSSIMWDRMTDKSFHSLLDLQKQKIGGTLFNLKMLGTVHILLAEYIKKISDEKNAIHTINKQDLLEILSSQRFLAEHIDHQFPSIKFIADQANMSTTKYKRLFKKITDNSPCSYFIDKKLLKAKELLDTKDMTILEISEKLNFGTASYFGLRFKKKFGLNPLTYKLQL